MKTHNFEHHFNEWCKNGRPNQTGEKYAGELIAWIGTWNTETSYWIKKGYSFPCEIIYDDGWSQRITIALDGDRNRVNVFEDNGFIEPNFISVEDEALIIAISKRITELFTLKAKG